MFQRREADETEISTIWRLIEMKRDLNGITAHLTAHWTFLCELISLLLSPSGPSTPWRRWCWPLEAQVITPTRSERQMLRSRELIPPSVLLLASALSNMLFPALSFMAVGGVMFLITNMQVRRNTPFTRTADTGNVYRCSLALFAVLWLLW